jgi:Tc5 transposase DNA-binding domain
MSPKRRRSARTSKKMNVKTKKIVNLQTRVAQSQAFKELLVRRHANGGELSYGDITKIADEYKEEFPKVTKRHLYYRLEMLKKKGLIQLPSEQQPPTSELYVAAPEQTIINVSDLTEVNSSDDNSTSSSVAEMEPHVSKSKTKKKRDKNSQKYVQDLKVAKTKATNKYLEEKLKSEAEGRKISNGTVDSIIESAIAEFNLTPTSISKQTIYSRVRRNNTAGTQPQKMSPIEEIEPLIVEWCVKLAKMGKPLTRNDVIELASEIIEGTKYTDNLIKFKDKRNIQEDGERSRLSHGWYRGFMNRHKEALKRRKCKVKDTNRHTWCTYENFANMYTGVYEAMVEAGVATKV